MGSTLASTSGMGASATLTAASGAGSIGWLVVIVPSLHATRSAM
jgi:hypothetical protein